MATLSITIPDDKATEIRDAFAFQLGWNSDEGTKAAFMKKKVAEFIKNVYREYKAQQAGEAARQSIDSVDIS